MRVFVENLEFLGKHGVYDEERAEGRIYRVDIGAELDRWASNDAIADTLDYRRLANIVLEVASGDSVNLIETLADRIAQRAFDRHPEVNAIDLTIRKKATGVAGEPDWVGAAFAVTREQWNQRSGGA